MAPKTTQKKSSAPKQKASSKKSPAKKPVKKGQAAPDPRKQTIAQRTVAWKTRGRRGLLAWAGIGLFCLLAAFFFFALVGYSFSGLVCLAIAGIIAFYYGTGLLLEKFPGGMRLLRRIFTLCLATGLLIAALTLGVVIEASFGEPDRDIGYLVVLGAGVHGDQPSLSLRNRIDAAYDYLSANPEVVAILSGGQGPGENLTEARCMYDHLTALGIDPARLWLEEQATSTWENLTFSLDLIQEKTGTRPETLGVLSSEYHLFRASLFTADCGAEFVGIPAKTTKISLRINYFLREVAGVWHYLILGGQYE